MKINKIMLVFVAIFLMVGIFVSADMPNPTITDNSEWKVIHTTDYEYTPYIANLKDKKTTLGLIPNNGICPSETRQLYDRENNLILDDKNKPITLKCESSKCSELNCYSISLTNVQAVNIDDYVKIGLESTTYEWIKDILYIYNTDTYNVNGFEIEIYTDEIKIESPDIKWIEDNPIDNKIVFYPNLSNIVYPLEDVSFKVNDFIIPKERRRINPYFSVITNWVLDFSTFENKNEVINKTIETIYGEDEFGFQEILGYFIFYGGLIWNLDPVMNLIYDGASDIVFTNITEGSAKGARIDTPVLFMDFNKPPEDLTKGNYINGTEDYVQDNSVYNNYGDIGNLILDGQWVSGNYSGGLEFDGVDDRVDSGNGAPLDDIGNGDFSLSFWMKSKDTTPNSYGMLFSKGLFFTSSLTQNRLFLWFFGVNVAFSVNTQPFDTNWNHIVLVIDRTTNLSTVYMNTIKDSVEIDISSVAFDVSNAQAVAWGARYDGFLPYEGLIDEARIYNRTLNTTEITSLYSSNIVLNSTGLVSHWALNETSGLVAEDTVGVNNGTLTGYSTHNPTYNSSCTAFTGSGGCYEFDGVDDYIEATVTQDKNTTVLWFKNSTGSWTHGVWLSNGTNYTNGVVGNPSNYPIYISGNTIQIGKTGSSNYFNGSLDNIQIWDRALSSDEISTLYSDYSSIGKYSKSGDFKSLVFYNQTSVFWNTTFSMADSDGSGVDLSDPNLVSYWKLDENYLDTMGLNNGTPFGTNNATGLSSDAMMFDGIDDRVDSGNGAPLDDIGNGDFSISFWMKSKDTVPLNSGHLFAKWDGTEGILFRSQATSNQLSLYYKKGAIVGANNFFSVSTTPFDTNWNHIVLVIDRTTDKAIVYMNTIKDATEMDISTLPADSSNAGNVAWGAIDDGTFPYEGALDEVMIYNDTLTANEIKELYKIGLSQHASTNISLSTRTAASYNLSDTGLVSQWSFNSDNNGTDEMNRNNGSCASSATCPTWGQDYGVVGGGYDFDGADDYVEVVNSGDFTLSSASDEMTISVWMKYEPGDQYQRLIGSPTNFEIVLFGSNGASAGIAMRFVDIAQRSSYVGSSIINAGQWYHVVGVKDGTNIYIYINGKSEGTSTSNNAIAGDGSKVFIGAYAPSVRPFKGTIDEVLIFNRSLSASEVSDLYNLETKYIEWNDWSSETLMNDDVTSITANYSNFFQFKALFDSNDTEVSSYLINHTVEFGDFEDTPPTISIIYPPNNSEFELYFVNISLNLSASDVSGIDSYWYSRDDGTTNYSLTSNTTWISWGELEGSYNYTIMACVNDTVSNSACNYTNINITVLRTSTSGAESGAVYITIEPEVKNLTIKLKPVYYNKGKTLSFIYSPTQEYDGISFEIIGRNLYNASRILNISIVNASPQIFKDSLPDTIESLRILQEKTLWESDIISLSEFKPGENITFMVEVEGFNEHSLEKSRGQDNVLITIGKIDKESINFLVRIGEIIWEDNPLAGLLVILAVIFTGGFTFWKYKGTEKFNKWREKVERRRIERKQEEEGF